MRDDLTLAEVQAFVQRGVDLCSPDKELDKVPSKAVFAVDIERQRTVMP
jgi:hypothetical protein